jgi:predicted transcriptional regulator
MEVTIKLNPEIEALLAQLAQQQNTTTEELVMEAINEKFSSKTQSFSLKAQDDWERLIMGIGIDCNTSLSDKDVSSEGLYD